MKKSKNLAFAFIVLALAAITIFTVNSKKINAKTIDNQTVPYQIGDAVADLV